ncbi:MAG TPA: TlpA disulfide reductase family protein [Ilumatobacter sp.]|nr:TlpA disulfide reductase family protein [Ilumatobacter sp.]
MSSRRRLLAAVAGVALGLCGVGALMAFTGDDDDVDGEFVLDQPGIYPEPVTTIDQSGKPLPDIELQDANGQPVRLHSFTGEPLVINIWYSTCVPCARELRDFADVSDELGDSVQFVGVDPVDETDTMLAFAAERGVKYPLLRDADGELITSALVAIFPTTLFVSPDGRIVHQTGAIGADDLRRTIADLF